MSRVIQQPCQGLLPAKCTRVSNGQPCTHTSYSVNIILTRNNDHCSFRSETVGWQGREELLDERNVEITGDNHISCRPPGPYIRSSLATARKKGVNSHQPHFHHLLCQFLLLSKDPESNYFLNQSGCGPELSIN